MHYIPQHLVTWLHSPWGRCFWFFSAFVWGEPLWWRIRGAPLYGFMIVFNGFWDVLKNLGLPFLSLIAALWLWDVSSIRVWSRLFPFSPCLPCCHDALRCTNRSFGCATSAAPQWREPFYGAQGPQSQPSKSSRPCNGRTLSLMPLLKQLKSM